MTMTYERHIPLAGATNFRDLGGYRAADGRTVRWRRVFRSDALHDLTADDFAVLRDLGVGDVFDLRTAHELDTWGIGILTEHGLRHHHVPFNPSRGAQPGQVVTVPAFDDFEAFTQLYLDMLEEAGPSLGRVFTHLAESPEQGAVFHCTGGRDRTGMTAAFLLGVLGVPRETIAEDYALTGQYLVIPEVRRARMQEMYGSRPSLISEGPVVTPSEVITMTLAALDERYGSPEGYLESVGVTAEHREALQHALLGE
ncbi:MAG: tyrosine-protein phosphatase [Dehalococcoidia bacterium]|nr:tyrosine-protein phosphatase [Dehalococcoidia bacterium]